MSKDLKNKINKMNLILVCSAILLTSCGKKKEETEEVSKKIEFVKKETKYKKDETTEVLIDAPKIKKEDIVKIIKHGDHWHVFTKDGKEHITYVDPEKMGSDDSMTLVSVVSKNLLKGLNVSSIKKHGDHWHVYTADGREFLTYEDPSSLFPNISVGTYVGSHGNPNNSNNSGVSVIPTVIEKNGDEVVRILRHGDHWHIYTANGMEYVSYSDPSSKYPNVPIGTYVGSHGDSIDQNENKKPMVDNGSSTLIDTDLPSGIVRVIENTEVLKKLDLKEIKKHGDHYHLYTKNNIEYITHSKEIEKLFPNIEITEYIGNHGDNPVEPNTWPEGVTRIVDHKDHWHLYNAKGEEIGVVRVNPKSHYPNAEYIVENAGEYENINVDDSEIFSYESVTAKYEPELIRYLTENIRAMTGFGDLSREYAPVYGSNNQKTDIFYWLHGNHYHAITIKQLIQMEKSGEFGKFTAKDVVAILKYKFEKGIVLEEKLDDSEIAEKKLKFLKEYYKIEDKLDILRLGNMVQIYLTSPATEIHLSDLDIVNGKVVPKKELPKIAPKNKNTEEEKDENKKDKEKTKKEDKVLKDKKEQENIEKLKKIFKVSEDEEAIDKIYDIIDDLGALNELIINSDGTASYNGKIYDLKNIKEEPKEEMDEEVEEETEEADEEETEDTEEKEAVDSEEETEDTEDLE